MSVPTDSRPQTAVSTAPSNSTSAAAAAPPSEAASKLAEAIDDFLGDVEKKFRNISDEILTKLDDMAERCDRLEQEMLMRDANASTSTIDNRSRSTLKSGEEGDV